MAVPVVASNNEVHNTTTNANLTLTPPSGTAANDVLIAFVYIDNTSTVSTVGSGYTLIVGPQDGGNADERVYAYYKILSGAESNTSWAISAARQWSMTVHRITGADTTTPIDTSAGGTGSGASNSTSQPMPAITTTADECLILSIVCTDQTTYTPGSLTPPSTPTFTEIYDVENTGSNMGIGVASATKTPAGAVGTASWTINAADRAALISVAIKPAASSGQTVNQTDNVGITDTIEKTQAPVYTDSVGITETIEKTRGLDYTDSVGLTELISLTRGLSYEDAVGILDEFTTQISQTVMATDDIGITETIEKILNKDWTDSVGITETIEMARQQLYENSVGITDEVNISVGKFQTAVEDVGITDTWTLARNLGPTDNVQITDTVEKTIGKTLTDNVGITDSFTVAITLTVDRTDNVGVTDSATIDLQVGPVVIPLSLVDTKRDLAIAYLVANLVDTEVNLRRETIQDIAHAYWSHKAGDLDNQALSIMDHLRTNGFEGWEWLTAIT